MSNRRGFENRSGTSVIDLLVSLGILSLLFGGIFMVYFSIVDGIANIELRASGASILNQQVEVVRNLPYDKVGTIGGIPTGVIPPTQTIRVDNQDFILTTTIRNIDDSFDGTATTTPSDIAPADYKLVAFEVACAACQRFVPLNFTTTVSPKNLESDSSTGSIFVNVFDASGVGVAGATVRVVNASTSPAIDLSDTTNVNGVLQLVGVPTSSQSYSIQVSKDGYSSERTYLQGGAGNPNPVKPHATVALQTVTTVSFAIDRLSSLAVSASSYTCSPYAGRSFSLEGAKVIGTAPDVLKFSTSSVTESDGTKTFSELEWDTYSLAFNDSGYDLLGTTLLSPLNIDPGSSQSFRFIIQPADPSSLRVTVKDSATGAGITGAAVTLTKPSFSETKTTGRESLAFTDWSDGGYSSESSGIDRESEPGAVSLEVNEFGMYPLGDQWFVSDTIDLGGAASTLYEFSFDGSMPAGTGTDSIRFQLAANNDNSTWNFGGPNGSASTYYTSTTFTPAAALNGQRYLRYKAFLSTISETATPELNAVSLEFNSVCVPPYQVLFGGLATGTYTFEVSAPGYDDDTSSFQVDQNSEQLEILL